MAIYRRSSPARRGFTLLELLIVLLLLGLIAAIAAPRLERVYHSVQQAGQRDAIVSQLGGLGYRALQNASGYRLDNDSAAALLTLPAGWRLDIDSENPIIVYASGICLGGPLSLIAPDGRRTALYLEPPYCRPAPPPAPSL